MLCRFMMMVACLCPCGWTVAHAQSVENAPRVRAGEGSGTAVSSGTGASHPTRTAAEQSGEPLIDLLQVDESGQLRMIPAELLSDVPFLLPGQGLVNAPAVYVAAVEFRGRVIDDSAEGVLTTDVVVTRDHGWHTLNLNLNQAIFRDWDYAGQGESSPVEGSDREEGLSWRFRGLGRHQLMLTLRVPVRRVTSGYQLQLTLPPLPREFESRIELELDPGVVARAPVGATMFRQGTTPEDRVLVTAGISGPRLDISWQIPLPDPAYVGEVSTQWTVRHDLNGAGIRLFALADQWIQPERGALESVEVRIPTGWQLVSVSGDRYLSHAPTNGGSTVRVSFSSPLSERIRLQWVFSREVQESSQELTLDGLDYPGAARQSGTIAVEPPAGWQASWSESRSELVERLSPAAFRPGSSTLGLTFGYQTQPFKLSLDLRRRTPVCPIRPTWFLYARSNRLNLVADFRIDEQSGRLDLLDVVWPGGADEGWRIEWINDPSETAIDPEVDVAFRSGRISLPVDHGSREPRVRLALSRNVGMAQNFTLTLPGVSAPLVLPGVLVKSGSDDVLLELSTPDSLSLLAVGGATPPLSEWPAPFRFEESQILSYSTEHGPIHARLSIHGREVEASTTVHIEGLGLDWLSVIQRVELKIQFGRLSSIKFLVPQSLYSLIPEQGRREAFEFRVNGTPVSSAWSEQVVELLVPEPVKGEVIVEARYRFPWDHASGRSASSRLNLPILALLDADYSATRCSIPGGTHMPLIVQGNNWEPVSTAPDTRMWVYPGTVTVIPLVHAPSLTLPGPRQMTASAYCIAVFQSDGGYRVEMVYQLSEETRLWSCEIPRQALGVQFLAEDRVLPVERADFEGRTSYILRFPNREAVPSELRVIYGIHSADAMGGWGGATLELPRLSESIWIDELFVEIVLPDGMHLFSSPVGWSREFQWERHMLFWLRQPTDRLLQTRQRFADQPARSSPGGARYGFSRFGTAQSLSFTWMSRSLIVLLGAGVTLLMGFLLTRFPAMRGPLPLLGLGFLVSLVGLWYPEPLELLMQPALLGLILAWGASRLGVTGGRTGLIAPVDQGSQHTPGLQPTSSFLAKPVDPGSQSTIYRPMGHLEPTGSSVVPKK